MYRKEPYTGADLPLKHLCLTYDDGPGKHTYPIAKFLYDQNIKAVFFVVGKYAFHHQDILEKVSDLGHMIGNHTYDHPDMPYYLSINGDVQSQVLRTDAVIRRYVKNNTVYFRSPYGKWSQEVANELNENILSTLNHIGPIHWDIGGVDCFYWKSGKSVDDTVEEYYKNIVEKDKGIIVMHDDTADMNFLKNKNNTFELTKKLIPLLKLQGYKFVRIDEIESIKKDSCDLFKFRLRSSTGKYVSLSENENNAINLNGKKGSVLNEMSMEELGHGTFALKASNGLYFSLHAEKNDAIEASGKEVNEYATFDVIPLSSNQIALRAYNGNYLTMESKYGGRLIAKAPYIRGCEKFHFLPISIQKEKPITIQERFRRLKRQILYVKSKIQQGI